MEGDDSACKIEGCHFASVHISTYRTHSTYFTTYSTFNLCDYHKFHIKDGSKKYLFSIFMSFRCFIKPVCSTWQLRRLRQVLLVGTRMYIMERSSWMMEMEMEMKMKMKMRVSCFYVQMQVPGRAQFEHSPSFPARINA